MAFVVGNRARVKLSSTALAAGVLCPQPPLLGVVIAAAGGGGDADAITVLLGDGREIVVLGAYLDLIADVASSTIRNGFLDRVVNGWITPPNPPAAGVPYMSSYTGRVVDVYNVPVVGDSVLVAALQNGMFYELPIANVNILGDR
jgi:hypothetical protein